MAGIALLNEGLDELLHQYQYHRWSPDDGGIPGVVTRDRWIAPDEYDPIHEQILHL